MGLGFKIPNPVKDLERVGKEVKRAIKKDPVSEALEKALKGKGLELIFSNNGQRVTRRLKPGETLDFTYKYQGGLGSWIRRTKFRM